MGFSDVSCQLTSVFLRRNEEFGRLYNDVIEARRLSLPASLQLCDLSDLWLFNPSDVAVLFEVEWQKFQHGIWDVDQRVAVLFGVEWQKFQHGIWDVDQREAVLFEVEWQKFQHGIWDVDQRMKRAERTALFSEVLSGIMLQFEQEIFPTLRDFLRHFEDRSLFISTRGAQALLDMQSYALQDLLDLVEVVPSRLESAQKVVVSALALLSFVYQYLIGCVDKGGSKTYSPGSLFRFIFVAIVLFLGSYVWIKFRQASYTASRRKRKSRDESDVPGGVYCRAVKSTRGLVTHYKYEPRFKPLREKLESGASLEFNCLPLGSYDTRREAEIVRHIAVVLYGEEEGRPVEFEDGLWLPFPSVTEGEKCPPCGKEKAVWVTRKTKELYAELLREKANRLQLLHPAVETGSHHGHAGEASRRGPPPSSPGAPSTAMELTNLPSPHGGSGVVEQPTTSESHGLGQEALLAREVFSPCFSDCDFDQLMSSIPQLQENDFAAIDDLDQIRGDNSETDRVFGFESPLVPPQSSALDHLTPAIFGNLPQLGVGDRAIEIIEPYLNSATAITDRQLESLPEQVQLQQCVTYQEQLPERFSVSNVELLQKLHESEERNSELQQNLLEFKDRNSELHQNLLESKDRNSELQQNLLESKDRISELQQNMLESEDRNSGLQQKLRKAEVENEKWRSVFHQVAKLMVASNLDGYPVDIQ